MADNQANDSNTHLSESHIYRVATWNVRSLNSQKTKVILKSKADLTLLQEIWSPEEAIAKLIEDLTLINKSRSDGYGGTMMINRNDKITKITDPIDLNEDSAIIKVNLGGDRFIWVCSAYIPKRSKKNLLNFITMIQKIVPEKEWPYILLGGDFNINLQAQTDRVTETLNEICKTMGLTIVSNGRTRTLSEIDFFIHGQQIKVKDRGMNPSELSDHKYIWIDIAVESPQKSLRKTRIPDRKFAEKIIISCLNKCNDAHDFIRLFYEEIKTKRHKLMKVVKNKSRNQDLLNRILNNEDEDTLTVIREYWKEKVNECSNWFLDNRLKEAYGFLRRVYKFHEYNRRDGSLISKIKKDDGTITYEEDEVHRELINQPQLTQVKDSEPKYEQATPFPNLPLLSEEEMGDLIFKISSGKAASFDGISDIVFNKEQRSYQNKIKKSMDK